MNLTTTTAVSVPHTTIGIDLGDRKHSVCAMNAAGKVLEELKVSNARDPLDRLSKKYPSARIVLEVGTHSPWISRFFQERGHETIVANPRKTRAIYENQRKCDQYDAMMLARLGRLDPKLLHPIFHQGAQAQNDLLEIKQRDCLVKNRVSLISSLRCLAKSMGFRLPPSTTDYFVKRTRKALADDQADFLKSIELSLEIIEQMTEKIKALNDTIAKRCEDYEITERFRQIGGIGPITALTFCLTIDDPKRFRKSRDVGAYLGLVPRRDQSGSIDKQLRISKAGDVFLRRLLVGAAQYILGPFGKDCDLRRHGLKLVDRGGQGAKKKAVIAIARKLAVLMHTLWIKERDYQPCVKAT